uniref:Uncharacterized protein n=1 Tax=viral metagenome TaxID=1070528 RepID=A0A6C0K4H2_9ZZZZ
MSARLALSIVIQHWISEENNLRRHARQQFLKHAMDKRSLIMEFDTMSRFSELIYPLIKIPFSNDIFNRLYQRLSRYIVELLTMILKHDVSGHVCTKCEQHVTKFQKIGQSVFNVCRSKKCRTVHNIILHVF